MEFNTSLKIISFLFLIGTGYTMNNSIAVIDEETVLKHFKIDDVFNLIEKVLADFSRDAVIQPARIIMPAPPNG